MFNRYEIAASVVKYISISRALDLHITVHTVIPYNVGPLSTLEKQKNYYIFPSYPRVTILGPTDFSDNKWIYM